MSNRNVKRLYGSHNLPITPDSSDNDYEPLCARPSMEAKFQGLELSSHTDSEIETVDVCENEQYVPKTIKKKKKKKNKKQQLFDVACGSSDYFELDEIDRSVREVNKLLGSPVKPVEPPKPVVDPLQELLAVNLKDLDSNNELRRLFGPNEEERNRRRRPENAARLLARAPIVTRGVYPPNYLKPGLSMSIVYREDGVTHFRYDHSAQYQKHNTDFLRVIAHTHNPTAFNLTTGQKNMHVELMLEYADTLFRAEEYRLANGLVEMTIDCLQIAAHPSFKLNDKGARLEYKYVENRPFHVAILKYAYLLSNRACHRTALELAKLLLNLDPSDPLGVLMVIDTLAIKAREYKWLIDAVECWTKAKRAHLLHNICFSNALAHFHVATKNKEDLTTADSLLRTAIMRFPTMVNAILTTIPNVPSNTVKTHRMYTVYAEKETSRHLKEVVTLYADLTSAPWREPAVVKWFLRIAQELAEQFDAKNLKIDLQECINIRYQCFPFRAVEVVRHMSVIKPMANLVTEGTVPDVIRSVAADPYPSAGGIDRYRYLSAMEKTEENYTLTRWFLAAIVPDSDDSEDDEMQDFGRIGAVYQVGERGQVVESNNIVEAVAEAGVAAGIETGAAAGAAAGTAAGTDAGAAAGTAAGATAGTVAGAAAGTEVWAAAGTEAGAVAGSEAGAAAVSEAGAGAGDEARAEAELAVGAEAETGGHVVAAAAAELPALAAGRDGPQGNDGNPDLHFLTRAMSNAVRSLLQAYRGYNDDDEVGQQRRDNQHDGN